MSIRAFKHVNKIYSAQHFVTFWRNIHFKVMLKCVWFFYFVLFAIEMSSYSADFEAALLA